MENKLEHILQKLNKLNSNIVFFYYTKYRDRVKHNYCLSTKYITSDLNNIDMKSLYEDMNFQNSIEKDEKDFIVMLKKELPYYYKMSHLYAHFLALMEENTCGRIETIHATIIDNFIFNGDNMPISTRIALKHMNDNILLRTINEKDIKSDQLKILMKNANNLNSDFKKYNTNEYEFCKNSNLDDYEYIQNPPQDYTSGITDMDGMQAEVQEHVAKLQAQLASAQVQQQIASKQAMAASLSAKQFGQQMSKPTTHHIMPATSTSFVKPTDKSTIEKELALISEAHNIGAISNEKCQSLIYHVMNKRKGDILIPPPAKQGNITSDVGLYEKLQKMNPMSNEKIVKKILEDKKNGI